jgi:type I restriction enzyme S subunit
MPEKLKNGWTRVAFGDVVQLCRERSSDPTEDGFDRYVGLEHLEPGDLKIRRWGNVADGTTFTSIFRAGQVLFGKRRAYQRKVAVADFDGVCSGDIYVLEAKGDRLLPELLPFICQTDRFFEHAVGTSAGSLSPRTNWESLAGYEFALPPLDEQRRIAELLGAFCQAYEVAQTVDKRLEFVRCAHLRAFFAPRYRQGVSLAKVAHIVAGGTPSKSRPDFWGGDLPWASGKDLKGRHLTSTEDCLTAEGWREGTIAPRGATLVVVRGMILAHTFPVSRCQQDTAFNQDLRALIARDGLDPDYLLLWAEWAGPWFLSCCSESSHGTKRIEGRVFDQALIPVPDLREQKTFVTEHESILETAGNLAMRLAAQRELFKMALDELVGEAK